uniref:Uncharacterized protein n=1 Tax=Caenorhabditis japonica TaxID=281687 RepID=A0A8R1E0M7_CAEJA
MTEKLTYIVSGLSKSFEIFRKYPLAPCQGTLKASVLYLSATLYVGDHITRCRLSVGDVLIIIIIFRVG